jgi:hypothetical protein
MITRASAYHHSCCEFESRSGRVIQHNAIQLISDLRQFGNLLRVLRFGVPQGSVLGPKLYCIFAKPVGEICRCHGMSCHGMSYHSYADDTQVYQVIKPQGDWSDLSERFTDGFIKVHS